jgi:drug/metabolite transporter (DMT)-like permease
VTYLLPVVAVVLGVTVRNEHIDLLTIAGTLAVLTGVALSRRPQRA